MSFPIDSELGHLFAPEVAHESGTGDNLDLRRSVKKRSDVDLFKHKRRQNRSQRDRSLAFDIRLDDWPPAFEIDFFNASGVRCSRNRISWLFPRFADRLSFRPKTL
jgi:hypothetical protein